MSCVRGWGSPCKGGIIPPPDPPMGPLSPVLERVENLNNGRYLAYFGYNNNSEINIPIGSTNKFTGGGSTAQGRGQPTYFFGHRVYNAFAVEFDGTNLVWTLNGKTATANGSAAP